VEKKTMEKGELVNLVWLAGTIKKIDVREESAWVLIDCSAASESRPVNCTAYKDKAVLDTLRRFTERDYIQIKGMVRAWSQKSEDDSWRNGTEVRIHEISNTPPAAATTTKKAKASGGMPF
jgi:hypothetical protein